MNDTIWGKIEKPSLSISAIEQGIPRDLQLCQECFEKGRIKGIYEDHGVVFQCPKQSESHHRHDWWMACLKCGTEKQVHRANPIFGIPQWNKHVRNQHKKKKRISTNTFLRRPKKMNSAATAQVSEPVDNHTDDTLFPNQDDQSDAFPTPDDQETNLLVNTSSGPESIIFGQGENFLDKAKALWSPCNARGSNLGFSEGSSSARYFQQNVIANSDIGGMEYLVKQSLMGTRMDALAFIKEGFDLPPGHALLQMHIARLVFGLTPSEKQMLLNVMKGAEQVGMENGYAQATTEISTAFEDWASRENLGKSVNKKLIEDLADKRKLQAVCIENAFVWSTRIPAKLNDIRKFYIDGVHSIVQNIPFPEIHTDVPGHSYFSVIDCIRDFLGHKQDRRMATIPDGVSTSTFSSVTHPSVSRRAKAILQQLKRPDYLTSYLFFWSDDVEPNRLSKAGRGSVWIATMTIGTQLGDGHNFNNTYPLAIGKKGDDHDTIIEKIEDDMKRLRRGDFDAFFVGSMNKRVKILMSDMAHLADQPERRGFNYLRLGGKGFMARFGVSANHQECYKAIRACSICMKENKRRLYSGDHKLTPPACTRCMNWDVLKEQYNLGLATPPPDYPLLRDETLVSSSPNFYEQSPHCRLVRIGDLQKLKPFRITYDSLKTAVEMAHACYCDHGWSAKNVHAYLKVEGLNDDFISRTTEYATRCYALKMAQSAQNSQGDLLTEVTFYRVIRNDSERNPDKYKRVPFPPAWSRDGFEICQNPDVIMHMLFLGIVDDSMQLVQSWLKATKRNSQFINENASSLDPLIKMDIQWVNVLKYSGAAFGHWVSENYLGFARVMPWFYQNIEQIAPEHFTLPPENQQKGWNKHHNEYWLKVRGLDTSGKAHELRKRVEEYMAQEAPPQPLAETVKLASDVEEMVIALYVLLECVMSTHVSNKTIAKTNDAIRVFLSAYDTLNTSVKGTETSIFSIFNLACLMNIPDAMKMYGPLRQLWEGATRGEGFLRFVKPMMTQGFKHSNWHYHLLQKLGIAKAFQNILPQEKAERVPANSTAGVLSSRKGCFHKYKSHFDFKKVFEAKTTSTKAPISVILVLGKNKEVEVMSVVDTYEKVFKLCFTDDLPLLKFGFHYYKIVAESNGLNDDLVPWSKLAPDVIEIGYGLLLPLLATDFDDDMDIATNQMPLDTPQRFALISSNWKMLSPSTTLNDLVETGSASFD